MASVTPTQYRDQVAKLAKANVLKAIEVAEKINDPLFQAQAWSHVARYADHPLTFARKAAKAAAQGRDDYQRSAVRAWEVAALAERKLGSSARRALTDALSIAGSVMPIGSRAESLFLLFQAAFKISKHDASEVAEILRNSCSSGHWRSKRALKNVDMMLSGELMPREFFW